MAGTAQNCRHPLFLLMIDCNYLLRMNFFNSISSLCALLLLFGNTEIIFAQDFAYNFKHSSELTLPQPQEKPYQSEFFRVRGTPSVTVRTTTGNIEVYQNPDIDGIKVDLYLERSFSLWSGHRSLDNYRIILQQQGDHIIASIEEKKSGQGSSDVKFHFVVQTPAEVSTNLRTFRGDIFLEDVEGHHFVQNQLGNLSISNSGGEIRVASTTGNIDLTNLQGNIFAKTVNGDVNSVSNSGEVRIRSVSGNINVSDITGTLVSATTSGHIYADFREVSKGIHLETLSGNIDLLLPTTNGYDLEGRAMRYDLEGLNPLTISEKVQNRQRLNVVIREGGLPVQLSTMSGKIRVAESQY